jgi:hypothetical protein
MPEEHFQVERFFLDTFIAISCAQYNAHIQSGAVLGEPQEIGGNGE